MVESKTKKKILALLKEQGGHNGISYSGKTELYTIKFNKGIVISLSFDEMKELEF